MHTKRQFVSVVFSFFAAGLFSAASASSADSLNAPSGVNGTWYSKNGTIIAIRHNVARVSVSTSQPPCSGEFMARVFQRGTRVALDSARIHTDGVAPFRVFFRVENGLLHEVKPYPSGTSSALAYWHGATCGFGLSEGGAVFYRKPNR